MTDGEKADEYFENLWSDIEFRKYVSDNKIPLEFIIELINKLTEDFQKEIRALKGLLKKLADEKIEDSVITIQELKEQLEESRKENAELKIKMKGFENGEVAWQGDMDKTIKQNIELKAQIEKMKCCGNCQNQHNTLRQLETSRITYEEIKNTMGKKYREWLAIDEGNYLHSDIEAAYAQGKVDGLEESRKENAELKEQLEEMKSSWKEAKVKGLKVLELKSLRISDLEAQIEKKNEMLR